MAYMTDNTGSILTNTQREFLRGETEEEKTGARARALRARIRQRIRAGLEDFRLLFQKLPKDDRRQVFNSMSPGERRDWISSMIAFASSGIDSGEFMELVETGVTEALAEEGYPDADISVFIHINRNPISMDEIVRTIERGEELDRAAEVRLAFHSDELTEEHKERLRQGGHEQILEIIDDSDN